MLSRPCLRLSNFARNSPATCLDIEVVSLGLQRFHRVSKSDREKLCAKFVWTRPRASNPVRALWILRRTSHLWGLVCCCVGSLDLCLASGPDGLASGDMCPNLSPRVSPARSSASPNGAIHSNAACRSARGRGPGRSQQHMSSDNYRNNFRALGPIMNGARIIDEPRPTPNPPITSVTQWTPRYRRVTQINTMNVSAAAHSR